MRQPARIAPTPLFDRLVSSESLTQNPMEMAALDVAGLKASVARELERLLVSRSRRPRSAMTGERTTVDYGIGDHYMFDPRSSEDRQAFAEDLEKVVMRYEPRLQRVQINIEPPSDVDTRVRMDVEALLVMGELKEPLTFRLVKRGDFIELSP